MITASIFTANRKKLRTHIDIVIHKLLREDEFPIKMTMVAFWDIAPCSLTGVDRRFRGVYSLHHQAMMIALMMEAVRTSQTRST
jgi:hypothetical protein